MNGQMAHKYAASTTNCDNRLISVDDARRTGLSAAESMPGLPTEEVVLEASCGRILSEPVSNHEPMPRYNGAVLDGFAIRRGDLLGPGPWTLRIDGELKAGSRSTKWSTCDTGCALKVMTGAEIFGALDAVVALEDVVSDGESITIFQCPPRNANITARGKDAKCGTSLLSAGHVLTARDLALLAGLGRATVLVRERLRIACLSVGSELIEIGTKLGRGQMHDCNRPMLASVLKSKWIKYLDLGAIHDDARAVEYSLSLAANMADIVLVAGGSSGGAQTVMSEALEALGAVIAVRNVAMKPGKPLMTASLKGAVVLCLPGNPVSTAVTMDVLGWDIIRKRAGALKKPPVCSCGIAAFTAARTADIAEFPLVTIKDYHADGTPMLALTPAAHSGNLRRLTEADGFAHIAPGLGEVTDGMRLIWTPFCSER